MKTKQTFRTLAFIFLFMITGTQIIYAQQAPKKTPVTKAPTKKSTAKKKTASQKAGNVFICEGVGGYWYHSYANCPVLKKCKARILNIPKQQAIGQYYTKKCKKCN